MYPTTTASPLTYEVSRSTDAKAEPTSIGFDLNLYEPWISCASGVERKADSIPLFVRRSQAGIGQAEADLFMDKLSLVYLQLAKVLTEAKGQEDTAVVPAKIIEAAS